MATPATPSAIGQSATTHQQDSALESGQFDRHQVKLMEGKEVTLYLRGLRWRMVLQGIQTFLGAIALEERGQVSVLKHITKTELSSPKALFQTSIEAVTNGNWAIIMNCQTNYCGFINDTIVKLACHKGGFMGSDIDSACETLQKEINILTPLDHPNIVKLIGYIPPGSMSQTALMLTPRYKEVLSECLSSSSRTRRIGFARDLFTGLNYLHNNKILHRDIKPLNCMIDANQHLIIIDFGFAYALNEHESIVDEQKGTPYFMAPEIQHTDSNRQCHYGYGVDIYAATLLTAQLLAMTETKHLPAYCGRDKKLRWKQPLQWLQEHPHIAPQLSAALKHTSQTLEYG